MKDFDYWVQEFTPLIHSIINQYNIFKDREEYFQLGLCGLFEAYQNYNPEKGTFTTFAYYRIRGKILNHLKRKISTGEKEVHVEFDFLSYMLRTSDTNPLEKNLLLRQGIEHLKPELRKIIIYHYFEGYSFKEIAEKLQISYPTVKRRHKEALQKLKAFLQIP